MSKQYCPYCMTPLQEGETCKVCGLTAGNYIPSPHHLPPGTVLLDRYLVGRALGEGGFGITYIGCDLRLEMKVAIKEYYPLDRATRNASASLEVTSFIGPSEKSYERGKRKFLNEAQIMAKMAKQHVIVGVRDFFEANNTAYIVMEYVEGITFRELVDQRGGKIAPEELFPMIEPLFHALTMMHENGLIHRDISPDNLMLENGKIRLLDFGCAREASRGTETMTIALKHGYAPIEQYQQKGQGPWTDIYALSATIYYCLTGKTPPQALDRITEDTLLLPRKLGIDITARQEEALVKGMRLQPNRRYQTVEEFRAALYDAPAAETEEEVQETAAETDEEAQDAAAETSVVAPVMTADMSGEAEESANESEEFPVASEPEEAETEALIDSVSGDASNDASEQSTVEKVAEAPVEDSEDKPEEVQVEASVEESVEPETPTEEAEASAEPKSLVPKNTSRKKFYLAGGIAAACLVVVIIVAVALNSDAKDTVASRSGTEVAGSEAAAGEIAAESPVDSEVFAHAYRFTSGEGKELASLMENESVLSVVVDCGDFSASGITVTKPVRVESGTTWRTEDLTVTENGCLEVQGALDLAGYLRLCGSDGARLFIAEGAGFATGDGSLIWQDDAGCLVNAGEGEVSARTLTFSEDIFEQGNTVSVTSYEELLAASEGSSPISIDADIFLEEHTWIRVPVRISEGATVDAAANQSDGGNKFGLFATNGGVVVNYGTINASLGTWQDSAVINYGEAETSFGCNNESVLMNFGKMCAYWVSGMWDVSLFLNKGDFYAYDVYLDGGDLSNFGKIVVPEGNIEPTYRENGYFGIRIGSMLWNRNSGKISLSAGEMVNDGRIVNEGKFVVGESGEFNNAVFENDGLFRVKEGATVDPYREGIYYGSGEFDLGTADVVAYRTRVSPYRQDDWDSLLQDGGLGEVSRVTSAEELLEALADSEVEAVCVTGELVISSDLTVKKPLLIENGASLVLADGAALIAYGGEIVLLDASSLQGSSILLYEGAQLCLQENAALAVDGTLALDNSLLWGDKGSIRLDGAAFNLKNKSGYAFPNGASLAVDGCGITIQDNGVFIPSCREEITLSGARITLENGAYFTCTAPTVLENCSLDIGRSSVFRNVARRLSLNNCDVKISGEGELHSDVSNLTLDSETVLENRGTMCVYDGDTFAVHGLVTNYGDIELGTRCYFSQPINNHGNIYCNNGETLPDSYVTGNAPIVRE